jgi:glutamyl-tRNA synthetase
MSVIVRFAPSPTGYLHIGGARTALFNYLFARRNGGKFLLRIEDTDEQRSTDSAINAIFEGLDWLGLKPDENFVLQSKNLARHQEIVQKLLEKNQAYFCYTSQEELEEMRSASEAKNQVFRFKSPWRNKFQSQSSSIKPVIRIKAPIEGETIIRDLVQGEIRVKNSELDDLVMLRGDSTPTYMLAVVVDDYDMKVSHIIRGDDHLTNAFRQKIIYQAMDWRVPEFAHIPLIHGSDGAKLSKRHGATSVIDYKKMGYLPESMRNYLLRLGWSHGDSEIISDAQAIEWFSLDKVGKSPSRFDFVKLSSVNKHYIKEKTNEELFKLLFEQGENWSELAEFSNFEPINLEEKTRILKAINFCKISSSLLGELAARVLIYRDKFTKDFGQEDQKILVEKKSLIAELQKVFDDLENFNHNEIKNSLDNFAAARSLKIKDFGPALRIILTYSGSSAGGIFDVIEILQKTEVLRRIKNAVAKLNSNFV